MPIEPDAILLENLRDSLAAYQRAVIGAMTASATFFVLSLGLDANTSVPILYGQISVVAAWGIALVFFFLLGFYARSALANAEMALRELAPTDAVRRAIARSFSLATASGFYRIGSVLFCPATVLVTSAVRLHREVARGATFTVYGALGSLLLLLLVLIPYLLVMKHVWRPFGLRSDPPLQPTAPPEAEW